ncbi:MAG: glycosyltransferase family 2 protein [Alphaproteobacteria bacterium]|nr:glycosyltransferase family 2 protein [Alphaproteobacteria bacterium]
MPRVSIVIPCYNHGQYVDEAVNSCLAQSYDDIEIIIVNDGSTDEATNTLLNNYSKPKTKVINKQNEGLAEARNTGIAAATGKYILPLDADDKIGPTYIEKAVNVIENNDKIGIVYCLAEFFGAKQGLWPLKEYKFPDILNSNRIFCTALFRKSDWEKVGGYKKEMIYGLEDYEFWLSLIENGVGVYRIPEVLFYYRQHEVSMITKLSDSLEKYTFSFNKIFSFHTDMYKQNYNFLAKSMRRRFDAFCGKKPPFLYKEKTSSHKIYHIGKLQIKLRRNKK